MSVKSRCSRLWRGVTEEGEGIVDTLRGFTESGKRLGGWLGQRGVNFIRAMGPAGKELGDQIEGVGRPALRRFGRQMSASTEALRGLTKAERIQVAKIVDNVKGAKRGASEKVLKAAETIRERLDMDMGAAGSLGIMRRLGRTKVPTRGSGRAFPTRLNRRGRRIVDLALREGKSNPKVAAFLEQLVDEGRYPDADTAMDALRQFQEYRLRGTNHYFESVRFDFPEMYREWDPRTVLPETFKRNALMLEGVRRWGTEFEGLRPLFGRISKQGGRHGRALADQAETFIKAQFGVGGLVPPWHGDIANAWSNWETVSKLSGVFSPILQIGQRFVNTIDAPISSVLKANVQLPPVVNAWMKSADALKRQIERSGAITGFNALTEFSSGDQSLMRRVTQTVLTPFFAAARGNEYASALTASYAIQADVAALSRLMGRNGTLNRILDTVRHASLNPDRMLARRIKRRGVDPFEAAAKWQRGERMTVEEIQDVMQKAVEEEQFALNLLTEPIWWHTQPWMRLAWKFKTFGIRQTEFLVNHVVKETALGNPVPLLKIIAAGAIMGEVYHLSKDTLSGTDRSVTSLMRSRDPSKRTKEELAYRIIGNIAAQGGLGLINDLSWGIENYVWGPGVATARNALDFGAHVVQDPSQTALAIKDVLREEIVPLRQAGGLIEEAQARIAGEGSRFKEYSQIQNAARRFQEAQSEPGLAANVKRDVLRAFSGPEQYQTTPRTLRFRYAARAITANEPEKAQSYLEDLFVAQASTSAEVESLADNARASMRAHAPMGRLSEGARSEFLGLLSPERRASAKRLRREWIKDYERALTIATRNAKAEVRRRR